jgi:soluble cytochrome b562
VLSKEQKDQFNRLLDHRDEISESMFHIERILKTYFPEEFNMAYQHYIPQIVTALDDDPRWLPRGQINMQHTIKRILDKINKDDFSSGVSKFIK